MIELMELTRGRQYKNVDEVVADLKDAWCEIEDVSEERITAWREEDGDSIFYVLTLRKYGKGVSVIRVSWEVM